MKNRYCLTFRGKYTYYEPQFLTPRPRQRVPYVTLFSYLFKMAVKRS